MRAVGEVLPSANESKILYTMRVPLGVVAAITPWNFPVAIPLWKIAPALVYGNTVVWKPSIEAALTGKLIGELFQRAGLPENVLHVVQGRGSKVGQVLLEAPEVKAITFTGSNNVGQSILDTAGSTNKKNSAGAWRQKCSHHFSGCEYQTSCKTNDRRCYEANRTALYSD